MSKSIGDTFNQFQALLSIQMATYRTDKAQQTALLKDAETSLQSARSTEDLLLEMLETAKNARSSNAETKDKDIKTSKSTNNESENTKNAKAGGTKANLAGSYPSTSQV